MAAIDFITFISRNAADYAEFLKKHCANLASKKHKIRWKCVESLGTDAFAPKNKPQEKVRLPRGYRCVAQAKDQRHNSMNHAAALNLALEYIESDYVVFIDADMAITYRGWDEVIVNELQENGCFGASYHSKESKYRKFPTVYLFAFRKEVLKANLDFMPRLKKGKEAPARLTLGDEARYYNMKPGKVIKCDTGWDIPRQVKKAGFDGKGMPCYICTDKKSMLPFNDSNQKAKCRTKPTHMCEWHYNGKIFGSHKQACRSHPLGGEWGQIWKKRIELYLDKL